MRNKIIASLFLGLLHFVANTFCATPPNVVLIFMDDAGYGDFHPFGNPPYATPHVKRLAAEGGALTASLFRRPCVQPPARRC